MEDKVMTLAKLSNNWFPSAPSIFDRFFDGELMDWNRTNYSSTDTTLPAVNVKENDNEFLIDVAAPGLTKEDFKVNYDNGRLTISSEKKNRLEEKDGEKITRREFSYQSFQRSFTVSENVVDAEKIGANYENGILHITLPKREEVKPKPAKQIEIM
ncbi:Hsp20/alpha crystallin family protein [Carboxylicivirga sp. RSCT41]|uniref:Hsp20/alpha crystallin family protein n=1 Tax=Carboxylicivirga agarovorans TaxID=3417570 RepID=UPI003D33FDEF